MDLNLGLCFLVGAILGGLYVRWAMTRRYREAKRRVEVVLGRDIDLSAEDVAVNVMDRVRTLGLAHDLDEQRRRARQMAKADTLRFPDG